MRYVICDLCGGSGELRFYHHPPNRETVDYETCWSCHGEGVVESAPLAMWHEHEADVARERRLDPHV